jgi:hypothetical protein
MGLLWHIRLLEIKFWKEGLVPCSSRSDHPHKPSVRHPSVLGGKFWLWSARYLYRCCTQLLLLHYYSALALSILHCIFHCWMKVGSQGECALHLFMSSVTSRTSPLQPPKHRISGVAKWVLRLSTTEGQKSGASIFRVELVKRGAYMPGRTSLQLAGTSNNWRTSSVSVTTGYWLVHEGSEFESQQDKK